MHEHQRRQIEGRVAVRRLAQSSVYHQGRFLVDVHVIVKMNPPMLGREKLERLLYDVMGYTEIRVNEKAYTSGLQFNESLEICGRLSRLAASRGLRFSS